MSQDFWRLPKGVDEVLPPRARHLELLRRQVLDLFDLWGYDYIEPPIVEYLDALLVGNDLKLQTLQVADQISGRTLGVRADITAQAARIDANSLSAGNATRRLCYAGPVVRANPKGVLESRVPLKAGAEIYGCAGVDADLEIMCLAIDALQAAGVEKVVIELGHVGFVRALVDELVDKTAGFETTRARLVEAVRIKSEADIKAVYKTAGGSDPERYAAPASRLCRLVRLMGDTSAIAGARELFSEGSALDKKLLELVEQLDYCAARLKDLRPDAMVRFDLSAPVGFGYHQALVFALFDPDHGRAVARGGRYDGIGEQFGNARPATGFDLNLKTLLALPSVVRRIDSNSSTESVWVPYFEFRAQEQRAVSLSQSIAALRAQNIRVVRALSAADSRPRECGRELQHTANGWQPV